ncbi:unnamed protein product [Amoebophrya sp. A25]|nr:unnamed protein product [Amoebophrya sp. A25]|eukprot:GSA25T00012480001.1
MPSADSLAEWAAETERTAASSTAVWSKGQNARLQRMQDARARLEVSEELHAELDALTTECMRLEDERDSSEARLRELEITLQIEKEKIQHLKRTGGEVPSSSSRAHQEHFEEHVGVYFDTISKRLGLSIDVEHDASSTLFGNEHSALNASHSASSGATTSFGLSAAASQLLTEDTCRYRLTFTNLGFDKTRCFCAVIRLAPSLQVLEVDPPLDGGFLSALTRSTDSNEMSLAKFVVALRRAFLARYH